MITKKRAFGATLWSAVEQIGGQGVSTLFFLAFARVLAPEDFGIFAAGTILTGFATRFAVLGLDSAIVQRPELDVRDFSTALWITLGLSLVFASILVVFAAPFAWVFGDARIAEIIPFLALCVVATALNTTLTGRLRRDLEMKALAKRTMLANLFSGALATPFVLNGFGYWALVIQMTGGAVLTLGLTYLILSTPITLSFSRDAARALLRFGAPLTAADLLANYNRESPRLFVGLFLGVEVLGVFSMGMRVMNLLLQVVGVAFSQVTLPVLSAVNRATPEQISAVYFRLVRIAGAVMVPIFLMAIVFRELAVEVLLGAKWGDVAPILAFLGGAGLLTALTYINGSAIVAIGRPAGRLRYGFVRAVVGTLLLVAGAPLGAVYAAAALFLRNLIVEPLQLNYLLQRLGANFLDYLRSLRGVFLAAVVLFATASALIALQSGWKAPILLAAGIAISGISFSLVLLLVDPKFRLELNLLTKPEGSA